MSSVVEVMVEAIEKAGTPFMVGIPGNETLETIEAARQRGMRFILVKQESAGAMLAATWGDITGSPGVCLTTNGPGAANMVLGVTHAWMDRSPLLAITDQFATQTYAIGLRARLNQSALYAPISKWSSSIGAKTVSQQMRRAIRVAIGSPPGPVQLDIPANERTLEAGSYPTDVPIIPNVVPIVPDKSALKVALQMLGAAKNPILLVGMGVLWGGASAELVSFAERLGAPVLTTVKCKGVIPEDHPLSAGCVFGGLLERKLIEQADLIVAVGIDAIELPAGTWPYSAPVLALSNVHDQDGSVPATAEVEGDLKGILDGLAKWAPEGMNWGERASRAFRDEVSSSFKSSTKGLSPQRLMEIARSVLPRDTIATCDPGGSRLFCTTKWLSYAPRGFLASNGLASMGYSIPAAMAARIAYPDRPVVAFAGDGSFLMAIAEMQTCVRENLPIIVVVLDDGELGVMRVRQDMKNLPRYGTALGGIDWEHLLKGFGATGIAVDTENALGDALNAAIKSKQTTVIAARLDTSGYIDQFRLLRSRPG